MSNLECPNCKNTKSWKNVQFSGRDGTATCAVCNTEVKSKNGMQLDTVYGGMTFNIPKDK